MRAERALAIAEAFHDLRDRDHRGVAGEDGVGRARASRSRRIASASAAGPPAPPRPRSRRRARRGQIGDRRHALDRAFGSSPRSRRLALMRSFTCRGWPRPNRDRHVVAGEREHLRDAVAHQAGADDGDARFRSCSPRRVAAVGVEDVAGVEVRRLARRGTTAGRRGPTARRGGPSARAPGSPRARPWRVRCPRTSTRSAASGIRSARSH